MTYQEIYRRLLELEVLVHADIVEAEHIMEYKQLQQKIGFADCSEPSQENFSIFLEPELDNMQQV